MSPDHINPPLLQDITDDTNVTSSGLFYTPSKTTVNIRFNRFHGLNITPRDERTDLNLGDWCSGSHAWGETTALRVKKKKKPKKLLFAILTWRKCHDKTMSYEWCRVSPVCSGACMESCSLGLPGYWWGSRSQRPDWSVSPPGFSLGLSPVGKHHSYCTCSTTSALCVIDNAQGRRLCLVALQSGGPIIIIDE